MSLSARWSAALERLRAEGRHRELHPPVGVDFTSNDYLGYCGRRRAEVHRAMVPLPVGGMASRLLAAHPLWEEVETRLADWHGAESVLMMTSGYAANEGLLSTVVEEGDWVASDEHNHASIIDGLRLARTRGFAGVSPPTPWKFVFRHNDLGHLEEGLRAAAAARPAGGEMFVVTESLFSMGGDRAPLLGLVALARRYGAHVVVDEAHATGCHGPRGSGLVDAADLRGEVLATVHTGGKALGVAGAYICGGRLLREYLVNRCRHFIFTTAPPPALAPCWLAAVERVRGDEAGRRRLHGNAAFFRAALARAGVEAGGGEYIVPVTLGDDARAVRAAGQLQRRGYDVRAVRPPSVPPGTARLGISIHADHDPAELAGLAEAVAEVARA